MGPEVLIYEMYNVLDLQISFIVGDMSLVSDSGLILKFDHFQA